MKRCEINLTKTFREELNNIINYIKSSLKEPNIANVLHSKIIDSIYSLEFFPARFVKLNKYNILNLRKLQVGKYVIIYLVDDFIHKVYILHIFHGSQNYLDKI